MDFFARQEAARRTTRWLLVAFLISVVLVVLAIDAVVVLLFGAAEPDASPTAAVLGTSVVVLAIISRNPAWIRINMPASLGKPFYPGS